MQKNLEDFLIDINENDKIKNEILNLKNRFNFEDSSKNNQINFIKNNIIPIARKYGYNFTAEDYLKLKEKKLNQEDLETISGGKFSPKAIAIASGLTLVSLGGIVSSTFSSENSKPSSNIQQVSLTRRIQNSKNNRTPNRRTVGRNTKNISRKNFGYKSNFTKNQVKRQTNQQTKRQDFTKKQQSKKIAPTHFKNRFEEKQKITNNLNKNQTKTNNLNKNQTRTNNFSNANKLKIEENKPNVTKFKSNEEIFKSYCKIAKD
ncbi:MAG: hypothetical protein LBT82_02040, partial [Oscillospiraceae bacterium]|nr:hypothetical protein [Oscillospiraceae bacterium]